MVVSHDQGGGFQDSRPTTHDQPRSQCDTCSSVAKRPSRGAERVEQSADQCDDAVRAQARRPRLASGMPVGSRSGKRTFDARGAMLSEQGRHGPGVCGLKRTQSMAERLQRVQVGVERSRCRPEGRAWHLGCRSGPERGAVRVTAAIRGMLSAFVKGWTSDSPAVLYVEQAVKVLARPRAGGPRRPDVITVASNSGFLRRPGARNWCRLRR